MPSSSFFLPCLCVCSFCTLPVGSLSYHVLLTSFFAVQNLPMPSAYPRNLVNKRQVNTCFGVCSFWYGHKFKDLLPPAHHCTVVLSEQFLSPYHSRFTPFSPVFFANNFLRYDSYLVMGSGYGKVRPATGEKGSITLQNWKEKLGTKNWLGWVEFFDQEQVRLGGIENLLRHYLSESEIGGHLCQVLVHGLICIGYGIEANSSEMVSEGMAMIAQKAIAIDPLPDFDESRKSELSNFSELAESLEILARDRRAPEERAMLLLPGQSLVADNRFPLIWDIEKRFKLGPCSNSEEIRAACHLLSSLAFHAMYQGGPKDFGLLHVVTSAPAVTSLCVFLPSHAIPLMRRWWAFALAGYLWRGCPQRPSSDTFSSDRASPTASPQSWETICQLAFEHNDEHVVKGVLACAQASLEGWVAPEVQGHLQELAEIMLKLPNPPEQKGGLDDWWYPNDKNPWETVPDIRK